MSPPNSPNVSAPPPPPPPPPADWGKDWRQTKNNDQNGKPSGSIVSEISNSTKPKRVLSQGPTQQPPSNFAESPLFRKMQEKYNANSKAADDRSFVDNREQHGSRSEQKKFLTSQKPIISQRSVQFGNSNPQNCTSILINTSVGISKADALKYSIATLLLCTSSIVVGMHTYLAISAILSSVAVPVLFAVIAFVSASIVAGSTVYLINSFFSAVSSEKKIDLDKLQCSKSQDIVGNTADLPTPAQPPVTLGAQPSPSSSVLPLPPSSEGTSLPKKANGFSTPKAEMVNDDNRNTMLEQIRKGVKLKKVKEKKDEQQRQPNAVNQDIASILARRVAIEHSDSEDEHENGGCRSEEWDDGEEDYQQALNPLSENKKRCESSYSGNIFSNNAESKPTSPLHFSAPKAKKPLLPSKPANLQTKSKVPPVKKEGNINLVDSEVQDPSTLPVKKRARMFEN